MNGRACALGPGAARASGSKADLWNQPKQSAGKRDPSIQGTLLTAIKALGRPGGRHPSLWGPARSQPPDRFSPGFVCPPRARKPKNDWGV